MGITSSNKVVSPSRLDCGGTVKVTLALTAAPDILTNPTDIALVLDRSGSMAGATLAAMKEGARTFIDIIEEATDGVKDGSIGFGSRMGIVSFAEAATADTQLITSVDTLKSAVDALSAGGNTNHAAAFSKAIELFAPQSSNAKVIVLFTDGKTTVGPPPAPVAAQARSQGIIIYCIGLVGAGGVDVAALNNWATDPDVSHVAVTPDPTGLKELFAELAANITKPGATNIRIRERVTSDFIITSILPPAKGTALSVDDSALDWTIPALGASASESAVLEFYVRHVGTTSGVKPVNQSILYSDTEGNQVRFPDPTVEVDCPVVVRPEPCPPPVEITVAGCEDAVTADAGSVCLEGQGTILQLDVTLKRVCPGRRTALAVLLTEVDGQGRERDRGLKTFVIPAHDFPSCRDVVVKCIRFVALQLPDSAPCPTSLCRPRSFRVRLMAHSMDTDFQCCGASLTL